MMKLLAVKTRRRDRISADEEERQRAGHEIVTAIRFEPYGERSSELTSELKDPDGHLLAELTYGDTALIRRMNVGLRRRKNKDEQGYLLDTVDGRWARDRRSPGGTTPSPCRGPGRADPACRALRRGPPQRAAHQARPAHRRAEQRMAAMYALKRASRPSSS